LHVKSGDGGSGGGGAGEIVAGGWKRLGAMETVYLPYEKVVGYGCPENSWVYVPFLGGVRVMCGEVCPSRRLGMS